MIITPNLRRNLDEETDFLLSNLLIFMITGFWELIKDCPISMSLKS